MIKKANPSKFTFSDAETIVEKIHSLDRNLQYCDSPASFYGMTSEIGTVMRDFKLLEKRGVSFKIKSRKMKRDYYFDLEDIEYAFIDRAYEKCGREAAQKRTVAGKIAQYEHFFSEMLYYAPRMFPSNYKHLLFLEDQTAKQFNGTNDHL